jgi:cullin 3
MRKESINMERDMAVQSIIVKILKQEKRMDLYSLFERIDRSVKQFKPSMSMLKDSIEKLIEKDYVERDRHDQNVLVYKE